MQKPKSQNASKKKDSPQTKIVWLLGIIFAILAISYVVWQAPVAVLTQAPTSTASAQSGEDNTVPNHDKEALKAYDIYEEKLEEIEWPSDPTEATALVNRLRTPSIDAKPVLIRNAPVQQWAAFSKWNPHYLSLKLGQHLLNFKEKRSDPVFVYAEKKPLDSQVNSLKKRQNEQSKLASFRPLTMAQFWSIALDSSAANSTHMYYSGTISSAPEANPAQAQEAAVLLDDIQPVDLLAPKENHFINLWLGTPGVVAQTHFDQDPNFAIQIMGHKRWILSPPSEAGKILTFPYLHSSFRQSMIQFATRTPIDDVDLATASTSQPILDKKIRAFEVVAGPGNVLYLPPFWFHRVVTEDASIAINMWSAQAGGDPFLAATRVPVPIEPHWRDDERATATRFFLRRIAEALPQIPNFEFSSMIAQENRTGVASFDLLRAQYSILFRNAPIKQKHKFNCGIDTQNIVEKRVEGKLATGGHIAKIVRELSRVGDPYSVHILFSAYCEMILDTLFTARRVRPFLETCI